MSGVRIIPGSTGDIQSGRAEDIGLLILSTAATETPYTISRGTGTVLGSLQNLSGTSGSPFTYNFAPLQLSGYTIFAAHFGNFPDSNAPNVTAFWLLDLGSNTTNSVTINDGKGVSNAQILGTGTPAVPEPATWALMLFGFAGIGVTMRRRRQPALAQIA